MMITLCFHYSQQKIILKNNFYLSQIYQRREFSCFQASLNVLEKILIFLPLKFPYHPTPTSNILVSYSVNPYNS